MFARGLFLSLVLIAIRPLLGEEADAPGFSQVVPIFQKYCVGCHNATDKEGGLVLENYAGFLRGGDNGKVLELGRPDQSRMLLMITGKAEPAMPPEGSETPTEAELALLTRWFKAGALGPKQGEEISSTLITPKIPVTGKVRKPIHAMATSGDGKWLAVGRHGEIEILSGRETKPSRTLTGPTGHINDLTFSPDGQRLFAAAGEAGLFGEITIWNTANWQKEAPLRGHGDQLYSIAVSPDGKTFATGSYDQKILLWSLETKEPIRELTGHNGPVFDLAFHPEGQILASASGDRTVKLWNIQTGERLETFSEPEKEQYTVAFHKDGRNLVAGGVDNRIRVWQVSKTGKAGSNRILYTRFAHEGPVLRLAFSPDGLRLVSSSEDHTIKLWETKTYTLQQTLKDQSDWPVALAVAADNSQFFIGRLDGTLTPVPLETEGKIATSAKPLSSEPINFSARKSAHAAVAQVLEAEPNDEIQKPNPLTVPGSVFGVLMPAKGESHDTDFYQFHAKKGESWIIETNAGQTQSPADTMIDVLHPDGNPVERLLLRAVRDSYITFRPIDSTQNEVRVHNWEEMQLRQYLYMNGEVTRLFRMPQGPDSGFMFYKSQGKRKLYFDTSAIIHALGEPVYIVEPYAPGSKLVDNGLPVFPLYYSNDDDADRKLGTDSWLTFTAPETGNYVVRVQDVRGFGGPEFRYSLSIRPLYPDFHVTLGGKGATIPAGSGQRLKVNLDRIDNFDGPVEVKIENVPEGYIVSSPILVEAGHLEAEGVIHADKEAKPLEANAWNQVRVTATAQINDQPVTHDLGNLGHIKLGEKPKVLVYLAPDPNAAPSKSGPSNELTLAPGETMTAMLSIERNGFEGELKFEVDNLPHGVIVDNIGLSGVLIRTGETHRQIFLTAADWVADSTRQIDAVAIGEGGQASAPIVFNIRKPVLQTRN